MNRPLPTLCVILLSAVILPLLFRQPAEGKRVRLSMKPPVEARQSKGVLPKSETLDSLRVTLLADSISIAGFDKPLRSTRETFFVVNNSSVTIAWIDFEITYRDMEGRMLHRRDEHVDIDLPQGETRMVAVKSFDLQKSLYYHRSATPKNGAGIPFMVEIAIKGIGRRL